MQYVFSTGVLYACQNGTWGQIGGGGGGGPYLPLAGGTMTGPAVLFTGSTAPTQAAGDASTDIANDQFVSNAIAGVNPAVAVLAASTANLTGTYAQVGGGVGDTFTVTATGAFTLDGIAINTIGQRVLFKDQSTASQNGVYTATIVGTTGVSPVFTRASDYNTPADVNNTGAIPVQSGTANTTTSWLLTSQVTSIGSAGSALTYAQFTYSPTTLVQAASPGAGIATFAGGTQTVTSTPLKTNCLNKSMGFPCVVAIVAPTSISTTTSPGYTSWFTPAAAGVYRACGYVDVGAVGTAGTVQLAYQATYAGHTGNNALTPALTLTTSVGTIQQGCITLLADATTTISYGVILSGATGTPTIYYGMQLEQMQ